MEKKTTLQGLARPPIVVILGHVDHGKTTLLDNIRSTNVAAKEAGGITQTIGASVVTTKDGKKITFIDTPGHAAFSNMRSRGAKVADIAILVVDAADGVKPQTKEVLEYILAAKIPFIVAATKIDLPSANVESVQSQLEKEGVLFEGKGGDTPILGVSGKTGEGIQELLEMISLVSELNDIKADPEGLLDAVIVETGKDRRGPTATLVVRNGRLKVGDDIVSETEEVRVRGLFDWTGKPIEYIGSGEPALIMGFKNVPAVGSRIWGGGREEMVTTSLSEREIIDVSVKDGQIPLVLKAQSAGSLEAVISNLPEKIVVVASGVGDVTESDVFLAKASSALIFTFESKIPHQVRKLAETEGISIESFNIIYELFEKLEKIIEEGKVEILGRAQVLAEFPYDGKRVAGCKVLQGKIGKKDSLVLTRAEKELGKTSIVSLKKGRVDIDEAKQGEECGILFSPQLDFKVGDVILSVQK